MNQKVDIPIELLQYLTVQNGMTLEYPFYAFLYVTYGSVDIRLGNEPHTYRRNDLLLLSPGRSAYLEAEGDSELMMLGLTSSFLEDGLNMTLFTVCDSTLHPETDFLPLKKQLSFTADLYAKKDKDISYTLLGSCYLILGELQRLFDNEGKAQSGETRYSGRVRAIADYIDQNYAEPITLPDLAKKFYLTPQYLSAFFQENFHTTFKNYLNDQRLFYSLRDLRSSRLPISEIAIQNGFSSFSAYRKNFVRRYGMTPSEFRQKELQKEPTPHIMSDPAEHSAHPEYSDSIRVSIEVSMADTPQRFEKKDQIINIGAVQNLQSQRFRRSLADFCQRFSFRYIRVMGMVASSFLPAMLPDYAVNFLSLDSCLSYFHENQLIPFVELTRHQYNFTFPQENTARIGFIQRSERWFRLLESFLVHITSLWPLTWLRQWRFELWMTPADSAEHYAEDFQRVQSLLQRYIPGAVLGGPGYLRCVTPEEPDRILSVMQQKGIVPGFVSAYLSNYDFAVSDGEENDVMRCGISPDPDYPIHMAQDLWHCAKQHYPDLPFCITEWNSVFLPDFPIAHSRFQAAFLVKTQKEISPYCDLSGYWLFSDAQKFLPQFRAPSPYILGQGLLTSDYKPTAAYYSYHMMREMGEELYSAGKNYLICRKGPDHYQLLCYHYQHFLSQNAAGLNAGKGFSGIYDLFQQSPPLNVQVLLSDLRPGLYRIQRERINRRNGCLYDILVGELQHSTISELEFLQKSRDVSEDPLLETAMSLPEHRTIYLRSNGTLHLESFLSPHDVIFWDIIRQV